MYKNINSKGFTLIEMLIVVVIIGTLVLMFMPNPEMVIQDSKIKAMQLESDKLESFVLYYFHENNSYPVKGGDIITFAPEVKKVIDYELTKRKLSTSDYSVYGFKLVDDNLIKSELNGRELSHPYFVATKSSISGMVFSNDSYTTNKNIIHSALYFVSSNWSPPTTDTAPPLEVSSVTETHTDTTIRLTWNNPPDGDFDKVKIYRNNAFISQTSSDPFNDTGLTPNTTYIYKITTVDTSGNESSGVVLSVKTDNVVVANPIITNGLIGYWNSKQGVSGTTWNNIAPSTLGNYNATINGASVQSGGMYFNSVNDYVSIPTPTELQVNTSFTWEVRVKLSNNQINPEILADSQIYIFYPYPSSSLWGVSVFSTSSTKTEHTFSPYTITNGTEYYVTCTYDNITGNISLYVNNVLVNTRNYPINSRFTMKPSFRLGSFTGYSPIGIVDNFRIYNRVLTNAEISQNYAAKTDIGF